MWKFIKYEINGNYRFILGIIAVIIIASTIFQVSLKNEMENNYSTMNMYSSEIAIESTGGIRALFLTVSILLIFAVFFVAFFKVVGSFKDELSEDRGYLTFTLPLRGSQILGGKFLVAILWFLLIGISIVVYNICLASFLYKINPMATELIKNILSEGKSGIKAMIILSGLSTINTLLLIYLSMAIGKISFKNNKFGGLWFVIFIVLSTLVNYLVLQVSSRMGTFISVDNLALRTNINSVMSSFSQVSALEVIDGKFFLNIGYLLSTIFISVGAFLGTSYIIENKIDL